MGLCFLHACRKQGGPLRSHTGPVGGAHGIIKRSRRILLMRIASVYRTAAANAITGLLVQAYARERSASVLASSCTNCAKMIRIRTILAQNQRCARLRGRCIALRSPTPNLHLPTPALKAHHG